jgi:hypothetical protein
MKIMAKSFLFLLAGLLMAGQVRADKNPTDTPNPNTTRLAAACLPATSSTDLDFNNVRARINTGGDMWWDLQGQAEYEVPKGSGKTSMFSASLWIGGVDVNNQLKVAALRYRQVGNDFWPGPLTTDGTASIDGTVCQEYDKHYVITRAEVAAFKSWFADKTAYPDYKIPKIILDWPAHGDVTKGQSFYLAPFFDYNSDGNYDPNSGDYPYYDMENDLCGRPDKTMEGNGILVDQVLKGDKTLWWVFNDKGNIHTETGGSPIGLEIRAQAFAFATNDEINNMTFYTYEIINRSTFRLKDTYFSQWVDTDLGFADDDYVGCDVRRGLGYCYNGDDYDGSGQAWAYGDQPPAVGVDFFQGPYMDADGLDNPRFDQSGNQIVDESINGVNFGNGTIDDERFGMRRFVYHNNSNSGVPQYMHDPQTAAQYYNFLRGIWRDGTKMLYGGNAHISSGAYGPECDFMFPGDSDPWNWGTGGQVPNGIKFWTEVTANNQPQDRRFMQSAGPFTLEPGAVNYITVGIPWARAASGGAWASVELLRQIDDKCQALFDNCFKIVEGPDAPDLIIQELDRELILYIKNRKDNANANEDYSVFDPGIISPDSLGSQDRYDSTYNFEGYQIYQLADATVSVSEVYDPTKARLVAQCDIKNFDKLGNPIGRLVNFYYDDNAGALAPRVEVNGANTGIVHSFRIFEDQFASGNKRLVNNKQYYFVAVAYAHNEYVKYIQDDPMASHGQKKTYLGSRKNQSGGTIRATTGIPHITSPEASGTKLQSEYGDGPKVTRLEGQGNGGMILDLTNESVDQIVSSPPYRLNNPEYKNGFGPINVKVIDPLSIQRGTYILKFDQAGKLDTAKWVLTNAETNETWTAERSIQVGNEQLLLDLGISISIQQVAEPGTAESTDNGFLTSWIEYEDSNNLWLAGVPDSDAPGELNWIRAGTLVDEAEPENNDYDYTGVSAGSGIDDNEMYEKIIGGTWAPYRLGSKYEHGPTRAALLSLNRMENLSSVDIVLTPDKTKWTRCPIIETGEEDILSIGKAKKFELRKSNSVNKEGADDGTGTGMGWFPGYAVNVETGERLNMMFGESSWLAGENGADMLFNPSANYYTDLGEVLFGGKHFVYVFGHTRDGVDYSPVYDEGAWAYGKLLSASTTDLRKLYSEVMWVGMPMARNNTTWLGGDVRLKIRVGKPYKRYFSSTGVGAATPQNADYPMYSFKTDDIYTMTNNNETAVDALDIIRVVPNPYYAYSSYETSQLDNRVKITNLPERCTISIYTVNGTLVRQYTKDNVDTYIDWDLKNFAGIPIAGGVYLIHVDAPGIGVKVVKWFGALRPVDLNSF